MRARRRRLYLLEVGVRWPPETFVGWKLEGMAARGFRVAVASPAIWDRDVRLPGVELISLPPRRPPKGAAIRANLALLLRSPRRMLKLVRAVRRMPPDTRRGTLALVARFAPLARLRPDIVHFEWHGVAVDHLPLFDVWDCPVVTSCRGSDINVYPHVPGREHYARGLPEVLRKASAVHCVSESLKREAVAFGLDPAKAWVVRPADDPEVFRPQPADGRRHAGKTDGELRVVSVGGLRWEKGYEYGLQAIRALRDRGVPARLEIVGGVPEEWRGKSGELEHILHTVAELGLEGSVRLHGQVPPAEVSVRLRSSDVLMHASVTEGIPNAILEGMACGLPVVATDCGGVREAVTDGVEGFLVAPREPEQLAESLARLWANPQLRERMGRAARERFLSEFTLEHEHRAFIEMYLEVAGA